MSEEKISGTRLTDAAKLLAFVEAVASVRGDVHIEAVDIDTETSRIVLCVGDLHVCAEVMR